MLYFRIVMLRRTHTHTHTHTLAITSKDTKFLVNVLLDSNFMFVWQLHIQKLKEILKTSKS